MTPPRQNAFDRFRVIEKIALKIGESIQDRKARAVTLKRER